MMYKRTSFLVALILAMFVGGKAFAQTQLLFQFDCNAGEIVKFNGILWECAQDTAGGGGGPNFVLLDSDTPPKQVGTVIAVTRSGIVEVTTLVEFQDTGGQDRIAALRVVADKIPEAGGLRFLELDCGGVPYIRVVTGFQPGIDPSTVFFDGAMLQLYIGISAPQQLTTLSNRPGPSSCFNFPQTVNVVEAELVDPDLHGTFPPPYSLEQQ